MSLRKLLPLRLLILCYSENAKCTNCSLPVYSVPAACVCLSLCKNNPDLSLSSGSPQQYPSQLCATRHLLMAVLQSLLMIYCDIQSASTKISIQQVPLWVTRLYFHRLLCAHSRVRGFFTKFHFESMQMLELYYVSHSSLSLSHAHTCT